MELMVSAGGFGVGLAAAYGFGVFPARCGIVTQLGGDRVTSKCIKLASSFGFAVLIALIVICVLINLKDLLALTSTAFGLAVGWATGILAAPYKSEQQRFERIGTVVAAFISGFAVSKIDSLFSLWVDAQTGPLILQEAFAHRALLFGTSFVLAAVVTYVGRKYVSFGPNAEAQESESGNGVGTGN